MRTVLLAALMSLGAAAPAFADSCDDLSTVLQNDWAQVNYESPKAERKDRMEHLATQANTVVSQCRGRAEPLVWDAIITASAAGLKGGLGALGDVKQARSMLEQAERIKPDAMDGSVYTTLGSLYAQVPGAPISFGDKNKARGYLTKALQISPNGIDPNFFMADLLMREHDYAGAMRYLNKVMTAPARPGRDLADRGRRQEAQQMMGEVRKHLS
ncbi:MAG TPA: TRAP transporter TatT component family protein [Caulobacteraceae bacterium]|nr:TRAP transporter TatT component family protein [Caulobacteraceae bacterium]